MAGQRHNLVAVAGMLLLSAVVHADIMPEPLATADIGGVSVHALRSQASAWTGGATSEVAGVNCQDGLHRVSRETSSRIPAGADLSGYCDYFTIGSLHSGPLSFFGTARSGIEPVSRTQSVQILWDDQSSFGLGVYALISLGLFRCVGLVKKVSFRVIPDWYHDGRPFQVGHSLAISPDCLCSAPAHCFVQPDCGPQEHRPGYYRAAVVAFWRTAQRVLTVLVPRGPPDRLSQLVPARCQVWQEL